MAIRFLCASHRAQLEGSTLVAAQRWDDWMERGREAFADKQWLRALQFFGCSFELAEMALAEHCRPTLMALDRYMVSGHFLASCFARCGKPDLQKHSLLAVHYRLLKTLRQPAGAGLSLENNIAISMQMLERCFANAGGSAELDACRRETARLCRRRWH